MRDGYGVRVIERGRSALEGLGAEVDRADPGGLVLPRSRLLCAGLAELAVTVLGSLGSAGAEQEVVSLAAALSLLTKIDDEVIDALAFHGGHSVPRARVRARTTAFLDVTLRAVASGVADSDQPRCLFAAAIGRRMQALATTASAHEALLTLVREGWATQVDAVVCLTDDPVGVDLREVERVTRRISGDWLALIAACGALPSGDSLGSAEVEAIRDAGAFIQRADSLADLEKDQREGLTSTWAACHIARAGVARGPLALRYQTAALLDLEQQTSPGAASQSIARRLQRFPELAGWLDWIRGMLIDRYKAHSLYPGNTQRVGGASCGAR